MSAHTNRGNPSAARVSAAIRSASCDDGLGVLEDGGSNGEEPAIERAPLTPEMEALGDDWTVLAEESDGSLTPLAEGDELLNAFAARSGSTWGDGQWTSGESKYDIIKLWARQKYGGQTGSGAEMCWGEGLRWE